MLGQPRYKAMGRRAIHFVPGSRDRQKQGLFTLAKEAAFKGHLGELVGKFRQDVPCVNGVYAIYDSDLGYLLTARQTRGRLRLTVTSRFAGRNLKIYEEFSSCTSVVLSDYSLPVGRQEDLDGCLLALRMFGKGFLPNLKTL